MGSSELVFKNLFLEKKGELGKGWIFKEIPPTQLATLFKG